MASPLYDGLSVELSKRLDDAVAAASSSGDVWSTTQRDIPLNFACKTLMTKYGAEEDTDFFRSLIESEGQAMTSNEIALSSYTGGVFKILSARNGTTVVKPLPQDWVDDIASIESMPWYNATTTNQYYYEESGNLVNVGGGATDTITLRYVKNWSDLTASNATDIPVPSQYFAEILDVAVKYALQEMGVLAKASVG